MIKLSDCDYCKKCHKKSARGIWNSVADPQKIPLEEVAWESDVAERYGRDGENT